MIPYLVLSVRVRGDQPNTFSSFALEKSDVYLAGRQRAMSTRDCPSASGCYASIANDKRFGVFVL